MEKLTITYRLCPKCQRALPSSSKEHYCPNDGSKMLDSCSHCGETIKSPYSRFCTSCGESLLGDAASPAAIPIRNRDGPDKAVSKQDSSGKGSNPH